MNCFEEGCRHGIWCLCEEQCNPPKKEPEKEDE